MATASLIDQLSELAADVLKDARSDAKPILKEGKKLAAAHGKSEARKAKEAKAASAKAAKPRKKRRLRKLLVLALLAAGGALAAKKLLGGRKAASLSSGWVEAPTAPGKHAGAPASEAPAADDAAGATPDEALADATEEPHPVTTPDAPAEVVELTDPDEAADEPAEAGRGSTTP